MTKPKSKIARWARRIELRGLLLGAGTVFGLWMFSLYNQLEHKPTNPQIVDERANLIALPTIRQMAETRAAFNHDQIHPHADERWQEEIEKRLLGLGIEPDIGTLDLIDTIGEHYNKPSIRVVRDLEEIARGRYQYAEDYGVTFTRRLVGEAVNGNEVSPLAMKDVRYELVQAWKGKTSNQNWILRHYIAKDPNAPNRRTLPDDGKLAAQSFLNVMPMIMASR